MFAKRNDEIRNKSLHKNQDSSKENSIPAKNPYFKKEQNNNNQQSTPMDIDPTSSKFRQ